MRQLLPLLHQLVPLLRLPQRLVILVGELAGAKGELGWVLVKFNFAHAPSFLFLLFQLMLIFLIRVVILNIGMLGIEMKGFHSLLYFTQEILLYSDD